VIRLLAGDCRDVLATLAADSVQCVVSSPPYYGLRDYGTAQWDGGDAACDHREVQAQNRPGRETPGGRGGTFPTSERAYKRECGKCGATRVDRQIGLEATPDEYLATMVAVFREVRRVLRRDGTCWVNMGDSFSTGNGMRSNNNGTGASSLKADGRDEASRLHSLSLTKTIGMALPRVEHGLAAKQLLMMPARLALALQADGWWVRSDIIWHKPSAMPESCRDRPTSAHEHVFLLTKAARYYYDADAVREASDASEASKARYAYGRYEGNGDAKRFERSGKPDYLTIDGNNYGQSGRNLRNVWTITTAPYSEAHFATYPPALAERCIKAGTSERGCCGQCGKPWVRETSVSYTNAGNGNNNMKRKGGGDYEAAMSSRPYDVRKLKDVETTGWRAGCGHEASVVPCTVLDPFAGAGTTLLVADRLQRDAIGIELNPAYTEMAMERCRADAPLFVDVPPAADPEDARMADLFAGDEYQRLPPPLPDRRDGFRNSERYVNQGASPGNGLPEAAE
jgi:DNA modification methylase